MYVAEGFLKGHLFGSLTPFLYVCVFTKKSTANCAKFQVIPIYIANIQHNGYYCVNYKLMCCICGINWDKSYKIHALIEILHIRLAVHGLECEL